jgi:hypothetical protein
MLVRQPYSHPAPSKPPSLRSSPIGQRALCAARHVHGRVRCERRQLARQRQAASHHQLCTRGPPPSDTLGDERRAVFPSFTRGAGAAAAAAHRKESHGACAAAVRSTVLGGPLHRGVAHTKERKKLLFELPGRGAHALGLAPSPRPSRGFNPSSSRAAHAASVLPQHAIAARAPSLHPPPALPPLPPARSLSRATWDFASFHGQAKNHNVRIVRIRSNCKNHNHITSLHGRDSPSLRPASPSSSAGSTACTYAATELSGRRWPAANERTSRLSAKRRAGPSSAAARGGLPKEGRPWGREGSRGEARAGMLSDCGCRGGQHG